MIESLAYSQGQPWFGAAAEDRNGTVTLIDLARESVQTSKREPGRLTMNL